MPLQPLLADPSSESLPATNDGLPVGNEVPPGAAVVDQAAQQGSPDAGSGPGASSGAAEPSANPFHVLSFMEYSTRMREAHAAQGVDPETDPAAGPGLKDKVLGALKSVGGGLLSIVTHPIASNLSARRGANDAIISGVQTLFDLTALTHPVRDNPTEEFGTKITSALQGFSERVFGKPDARPSQQFVQSTAQFLTGFMALPELEGPAALGAVGKVLPAMVKGAVADFAAFDPYKPQLAELAQDWGVNPHGLLTVDLQDSPIVARTKRAAAGLVAGAATEITAGAVKAVPGVVRATGQLNEFGAVSFGGESVADAVAKQLRQNMAGIVPDVAVDGIIASADIQRAAAVLKDASASAEHRTAAQDVLDHSIKVLQDIKAGTHIPDQPIVVVPDAATGGVKAQMNEQFKPYDETRVPQASPAADRMKKILTAPMPELHLESVDQLQGYIQRLQGDRRGTISYAADAPGGVERRAAASDRRAPAPASAPTPNAPDLHARVAQVNARLNQMYRGSRALTDADMEGVRALADKIQAVAHDPEKMLDLLQSDAHFNYTYMDTPDKLASIHQAITEVLSPVFEKAANSGGAPWAETMRRAKIARGMIPEDQAGDIFHHVANLLGNSDVWQANLDAEMRQSADLFSQASSQHLADPTSPVAADNMRGAFKRSVAAGINKRIAESGQGRGLGFLGSAEHGDNSLLSIKFGSAKGEPLNNVKAPAGKGKPDPVQGPQMSPVQAAYEKAIEGLSDERIASYGQLLRITKDPVGLMKGLTKELVPDNAPPPPTLTGAAGNAVMQIAYANMLSAPTTWQSIFASTGFISVTEDLLPALAGAARLDPTQAMRTVDLLTGRMLYLKGSLKSMVRAGAAGHSIIDGRPALEGLAGLGQQLGTKVGSIAGDAGATLGGKVGGAIGTAADQVVRTFAARPISALDELITANTVLANTHTLAMAVARQDATNQGLTGAARLKYMLDFSKKTVAASIDDGGVTRLPETLVPAELAGLRGPLPKGSIGAHLQGMIQDMPALKLIAPFVNMAGNAFNYSFVKGSPLGLLWKAQRDAMLAGGADGAIASARMAAGTAVWAGAFGLAMTHQVTGAGPSHPQAKAAWSTDHQPYSFQGADGKWHSYRRMEPLSTSLGLAADVVQAMHTVPDDETAQHQGNEILSALAIAGGNAMLQKSYMTGPMAALDAIHDGDYQGFAQKQLMSMLTPNMLNAFNTDPYMRQIQTMHDAFINRIPGWSQQLPVKYNWDGSPQVAAVSRQRNALDMTKTVDLGTAPSAESEMQQLHKYFQAPPTTESEGQLVINYLDPKYTSTKSGNKGVLPYERWMELLDQSGLRDRVNKTVSSSSYQNLGSGTTALAGGGRGIILAKLIDGMQHQAKMKMLEEYPQLFRDVTSLTQMRNLSKGSNDPQTQFNVTPTIRP